MKSAIWRLATCGLLSLAIAGQSLAEGQGHDGRGGNGNGGGGQWQGRPQGNGGGQGQGHSQGNPGGQWQGRPQGNPGGQWQGHQQGNQAGQWQGRPQGNPGGQWQGHQQNNQAGQWQGRPQGNPDGQWQGHQQNNQAGQWQGRPQSSQAGQWQGHQQGNGNGQWQSRPTAERDDHGNDRRPGDWTTQWPSLNHGDRDNHGYGRPSASGNSWQGRPPGGGNDWHGRPPGGNWGPHPDNWRPGYVVDRVPHGYRRVPWRGNDYFFSDGYWYRPHGPRYVMVAPPYGVRVDYLPSYAEQIWIGSVLYFLAAGTYYLFDSGSQSYEVVPPPAQVAQAPVEPSNPYDVIAYPMYGQGPQQQAQDHYECHTWAVGQSGFDPAMAQYAPPQQAVDAYRGALSACLSGRGYSIN
ncbi:DUF6515 family protein [Pseudomonas knackmussii]|uniref:DUF6515 family protein n=1 Tax=Pseudomonas knackmussii TaxID=65741 RepID=UPI003BE8AC6A